MFETDREYWDAAFASDDDDELRRIAKDYKIFCQFRIDINRALFKLFSMLAVGLWLIVFILKLLGD